MTEFLVWWALASIVVGLFIGAIIKVADDYREPITEDDIKALREEADRVVRLGDQHPWTRP